MRIILRVAAFFALAQSLFCTSAHAQYEVVPPGTPIRWNFWLSDGPAEILSESQFLGNRLQLGAEAHFGDDYQYFAGLSVLDLLSSGETSTDVGNISRYGFDLRIGAFLIADHLFVEYGLYLGEVSGSNIYGWNTTLGHELGVGYRFYDHQKINLALEAQYQFVGSQSVSTFQPEPSGGIFGQSTYPRANVYSLSLRLGFDVGGR